MKLMTTFHHATLLLFSPGLPPRHNLMLRSLHAHGWRISVIAWDRGVGESRMLSDYTDFIEDWQHIHIPGAIGSARNALRLGQLYRAYREVLARSEPPDLTIFSHLFLLPLLSAWPGKKVYDALEMYALNMSFYFGPLHRLMRPVMSLIEGFLARRADGILTVDSRQGWLETHYRRWNRLVTVLWNVPSRAEDPTQSEIAALGHAYGHRKAIMFVGGLLPQKGLRVALWAAATVVKKYPEALFVFIGPLRDNQIEVAALVKDLGIQENVRFMAPVPYSSLVAHLRHALVGLALYQHDRTYPYVSAGNGRKFFAYMQAGLPIVAPDFGEIGRAVQMAGCGVLVNTEDAQAVATAIIDLLDHPEEAARLGANGRKAFETRFNWEIEERKFLAFIDQVMTEEEA